MLSLLDVLNYKKKKNHNYIQTYQKKKLYTKKGVALSTLMGHRPIIVSPSN